MTTDAPQESPTTTDLDQLIQVAATVEPASSMPALRLVSRPKTPS